MDAFMQATIDYEVAQDDYAAAEYRFKLICEKYRTASAQRIADGGDRESALRDQIDAGVRFWREADAVGLVNLYDPAPSYVSQRVAAEIMATRLSEVEQRSKATRQARV